MNIIKNLKIRGSMYAIVCSMIIIPFLLFSIILSYTYYTKLEVVISNSLQAVADSKTMEMRDFCEGEMNSLKSMGETDTAINALLGKATPEGISYINEIFASTVKSKEYVESFALINTDNQVVACSEKNYDEYAKVGLQELIGCLGENPFYISNVYESTVNGVKRNVVVAIARIENEGNNLGYILAEFNLDFYKNIREHAELWADTTFYLLDGKFNIISAGTVDEERKNFITKEEERKDFVKSYRAVDFKANPQGSFTYKVGHNEYITYYSYVDYTDWQIMLTANLNNYYVSKYVCGLVCVFLVVIIILASIIIGKFTSKRIADPIEDISGTLNKIKDNNDYSQRINLNRNDELGELSYKINDLLVFIEKENLYKSKQQRILREKAERDPLTKTFNKEKINYVLNKAVNEAVNNKQTLAIVFVDVDDFKKFNSKYGHKVGDKVLKFVSDVLESKSKCVVGRAGGDEFLMLINEPKNIDEVKSILEAIKLETQRGIIAEGKRVAVSCCFGAVFCDFSKGKAVDAERLIDVADRAMYKVKNDGKNAYTICEYNKLNSNK